MCVFGNSYYVTICCWGVTMYMLYLCIYHYMKRKMVGKIFLQKLGCGLWYYKKKSVTLQQLFY